MGLNFSNDEICFIAKLLETGLHNIEKDRKAISYKKEILKNFFELKKIDDENSNLKEKFERELELYDNTVHEYLIEKENFVKGFFKKIDSYYEIIRDNDPESYDKAIYFIEDKPIVNLFKDSNLNNIFNNE